MKFYVVAVFILLFFNSCNLKGVDENKNSVEGLDSTKKSETDILENKKPSKPSDTLKKVEKDIASDTMFLDNGIIISYFKRGAGDKLKKGDVIKIDYRAKLEDGTVYDGNHLVKKTSIPFLVGWNQQTTGWDIALKELRVGDDVDIFLPSKYARGEQGIEGLVPPNANNIISLKVVEKMKPIKEGDGIQIWKYDELKTPGDSIGFGDEVQINYWVSSESNPRYDYSYKRGKHFTLVMGDGNIVPGLYKALYFGREGDRLMIKIPASEAYGKNGYLDFVKPNEELFYDIQISKVKKKDDSEK